MIIAAILLVAAAIQFFFPWGYVTGFVPSFTEPQEALNRIKLPQDFKIEIFADGIENARSLCHGPDGIIFVGTRSAGNVYAVMPAENSKRNVVTLASGLNMPNGVAFHDGALYVAEVSKILKFDAIQKSLGNSAQYTVVTDRFPSDEHHGWKFISFGPDGKLYVPVGFPCNICQPEGEIYGTITRMNPDGSGFEIFARGVRNTVGFDWHPQTKVLWFTDNGRDWMGDDKPPDELNIATKEGMHFGYPHCHGKSIQDPEFGKGKDCSQFTSPAQELGPHVAALGMRFYTGEMFPEKYRRGIFIAEHGSWNRSTPIGYRVMFVAVKNNQPVSYEVFAEGWLQGNNAWGRPVDVLVMPDGALLVSDDKGNAIYRISYGS